MSQCPQFIAAMEATQVDRESEIGRHVWQQHMDQYGPSGYMMELAGIVGRLGAILWPAVSELGELSPRQIAKVLDLLKDLGNYTGFTYEWFIQNTDGLDMSLEDGASSEAVQAMVMSGHLNHACSPECYDC